MRKFIALSAASLVVMGLAALPAGAATSDSTTVTFAVTSAGGLSVSDTVVDPATHTLGAGSFDASSVTTATGALPTVTVTDNRNPLLGGWTVSVGATEFDSATLDSADPPSPVYTIPGSKIKYYSGTPVLASGVVVTTGQQLLAANAVTLDQNRSAVVAAGALGNNSATFAPSLIVDVAGIPVDTYTGVITHSVTGS